MLVHYAFASQTPNASHHRQQKAERGTSVAFWCPSACDCWTKPLRGEKAPPL